MCVAPRGCQWLTEPNATETFHTHSDPQPRPFPHSPVLTQTTTCTARIAQSPTRPASQKTTPHCHYLPPIHTYTAITTTARFCAWRASYFARIYDLFNLLNGSALCYLGKNKHAEHENDVSIPHTKLDALRCIHMLTQHMHMLV